MGRINVLPFSVANLIAAGEVVDRPASVIKELLENAIDAGATRVAVEIRNGGTTFMRVTDNGCGIAKDDLPVAIKRHATSKIKDAADLDSILTLGFRGEALAAIAAVSDLRIITKVADAPLGHAMQAKAGEVLSVTEQGAPTGTTVIVENLFANVPARKKFLKKDVSEAIAVSTYVEKIALSHPEIALRLIVDGNIKLDTAGDGQLKSAMYAVFGRDFVTKTIPVSGGNTEVRVEGFIGRSDNVRPKRNYESFFINNRYINSRTAAAALEQAYTSFIPPEKFPCCVLNILIDPAKVDVNVHPAKLEVKFSDERTVFEAVYYAVRAALEENTDRPELKLPQQRPSATNAFVPIEEGKKESVASRQMGMAFAPAPEPSKTFERMSAVDFVAKYGSADTNGRAAATVNYGARLAGFAEQPYKPTEASARVENPKEADPTAREEAPLQPQTPSKAAVPLPPEPSADAQATQSPPWRMIGEAFNCYILVERGEELLLIDKHAAHERILFEDLKKNMLKKERTSQPLLVPLPITLSGEDLETLALYRDEVRAIGFEYRTGAHTLSVDEIPTGLSFDAAAELLQTLALSLREGTGNAALARELLFEKALYQSACKAAIKAGRTYPAEYLQWICDKLSEIPDITVCPHGRPVAMVLTHAMIDRRFERT